MSHGQHFHEPRTSRRRIYPRGLVGPDESDEGEAAIETLMPSRTRPTTTHANEEELLLESRCLLMAEFIEAAHRAALANATILLTGDSGTGKSAFAHQMHRWSRGSEAPFLSVDCAAISEHIHESDPFEDLRNSLAVLHDDREDRSGVSGLRYPAFGQSRGPPACRSGQASAIRRRASISSRLAHFRFARSNHRGVRSRSWRGGSGRAFPQRSLLPNQRHSVENSYLGGTPSGYSTPGRASAGANCASH